SLPRTSPIDRIAAAASTGRESINGRCALAFVARDLWGNGDSPGIMGAGRGCRRHGGARPLRDRGNRRRVVPSRPVIGVAMQTQQPISGQAPLAWIMGQKYIQVLASLGALPCLIPLLPGDEETLRCLYGRLDGVFLTGGVDVDPINYGELP